jgi:fructose-1,6-bisphosphatase II / sedoheptulose-1,7-bisphosphatase
MVAGDVIFAATGVTDGSMLDGVKFCGERVETHTVVMHAMTKTVRWLRTQHGAH